MKCGEWPGGPNYISGLFKPERSRVSLSIRPCKGSTMTSVTSFTRTPRGLPRDQWAPCRIEDTLRDETSSLLCGHLSVTQVSQKRRILYHLSLSSPVLVPYRSSRKKSNTFFLFFPSIAPKKIAQRYDEETERKKEAFELFRKVVALESHRASAFHRPVLPLLRESATTLLRPYRCHHHHLEHGDEGLVSARGKKDREGRGEGEG